MKKWSSLSATVRYKFVQYDISSKHFQNKKKVGQLYIHVPSITIQVSCLEWWYVTVYIARSYHLIWNSLTDACKWTLYHYIITCPVEDLQAYVLFMRINYHHQWLLNMQTYSYICESFCFHRLRFSQLLYWVVPHKPIVHHPNAYRLVDNHVRDD